jgi:hypothetical protein
MATISRHSETYRFTFAIRNLDSNQDLSIVQFVNPQIGWIGNQYGALYAIDEGKTWEPRPFNLDSQSNHTYFRAFIL